MQIRMVSLAAGPLGVLQAGEIVQVSEEMGAALIAVGAALALASPVETAVVAAPETAVVAAPETAVVAAPETAAAPGKSKRNRSNGR